MESLSIGQLAKRSRVHVETIRYYERRGLIPAPARHYSGYRQYSPGDVRRVLFIKRAQRLGFTLKEVSELLHLKVDPQTTCADVKRKVQIKMAEIGEKILELDAVRQALAKLAISCAGSDPTAECPILDALQQEEPHGSRQIESRPSD